MTSVSRLLSTVTALEARLHPAGRLQSSPAEWRAIERAIAAFARVHPDVAAGELIAALRARDQRAAEAALARVVCAHPDLRGDLADALRMAAKEAS